MQKRYKLLIVCTNQYGYHLDTWYYCKYMSEVFDITYVCWDFNKEKIHSNQVNVIYIKREGGKFKRLFNFLYTASKYVKENDLSFIKYFAGSSFLSFFSKKTIVDIRTASVSDSKIVRFLQDLILRLEVKFFKNVTVVSNGVKNKLKLSETALLLPLGANVIGSAPTQFDGVLKLLYVGTFTGRKIEESILGLSLFNERNPNIEIHYHIVGSGWSSEFNTLKSTVNVKGLDNNVSFHGYLHHEKLSELFSLCNLGVSYVPLTDYYEHQPATKTYEYLLSGMPVIATGTYENKKIVSENFGVVVQDTPDAFAAGLEVAYKRLINSDFSIDADTLSIFLWQNICKNLEINIINIIES